MKRALFVAGGWPGHQPERIVQLFAEALRPLGYDCRIETSLDILGQAEELADCDFVFPGWTMGSLTKEQTSVLVAAVRGGVGLGGIHGGMGDAFRGNLDYEWMVGGHFVGHPHVGDYTVRVIDPFHPVTTGLPPSFAYRSEQYYLLTDPAVQVLADTSYHHDEQVVTMPVAWVRRWGRGRVFYSALGHDPAEFTAHPAAMDLTLRGLRWAAGEIA